MSGRGEIRLIADVRCELGESPLWLSQRNRLLWFDIFGSAVYECHGDGRGLRVFHFDAPVSAAAIIDESSVAIGCGNGIYRLHLDSGERTLIASCESDRPIRINDGRVDLWGGFWFGTMGDPFAEGAGTLYRYARGELTVVRTGLNVPNCLAFSPDGKRAYFSDTTDHRIFYFPLDAKTGMPVAEPELFLDLSEEGINPDGAVVDVEGGLWNAQWGGGRVVRYLPDGTLDQVVEFPVSRTTCPAFGGPDHRTLYVTTARAGMSKQELVKEPLAGSVFAVDLNIAGLPENTLRI